jgi:nucleoside-diphosphate-sugar epimerase
MIGIQNKKIALVGGAGFIGHHLSVTLKNLGAEVHVLDNLSVNSLLFLSQSSTSVTNKDHYIGFIRQRLALFKKHDIALHTTDARDRHLIDEQLTEIKPDVVIMLAAVSHANRSNKDPYNTFDNSFNTLENVLEYCRDTDTHLIYFSSSMVYGNFTTQEITEDAICNPIGIYGTLKYCGERLIKSYHNVFDLSYTIIRPSALYGERCISRRVVQIFLENAISGQEIRIEGDGNSRLDFTYIKDLVHGVLRIITQQKSRNEIFNLTYGKSRSILELATMVKEEFPDMQIAFTPKNRLVPERGTLCITKARNLLNYQPEHPLEAGIKAYCQWYKEHFPA